MDCRNVLRVASATILLFLLLGDERLFSATPAHEAALGTPDAVVEELYDLVTFGPNIDPDWERVRSLFIDQAVVVLRTSREATTVFSVDGFVADFIAFIERADVRRTGFSEKIVRTNATVFGDIAHIWVLYEASLPGSERPPQQGVDSFELIQKDGRWWIAAITNEIPTPEHPVPAVLAE